MTELPLGLMATQVMMDRHVHERLLRLRPSSALLMKDGTFLVIMILEILCVISLDEIKALNGRYEVVQMVRVIVIAHTFRFMQSRFGHNKVPFVYYLRKVLLFHDLPITVLISAFYAIIRTFPIPSDDMNLAAIIFLSDLIVVYMPKGMELERFINPSEASSFNAELVPQQSHDADMDVDMDVQVTDHFVIILLAGLCVDLMIHLERLDARYNLGYSAVVLATTHASRYLQLIQGKNMVPPAYYNQKTILIYDIPIRAVIADDLYDFFDIFFQCLILLLALQYIVMVNMLDREKLNQTKEQDINPTQTPSNTQSVHQQSHDAGFGFVHDAFNRIEDAANANSIRDINNSRKWIHKDRTGSGGFGAVFVAKNRETKAIGAVKIQEFENDIIPAQACSLNIELLHQQNLDAANNSISSTSQFGPLEICDPPIKDGGFSSVHYASKRGGEDDAVAANSISDTTDFSKWVKGKRIGHGQYGNVYVVTHRDTGEQRAVKELNILKNENDESILQEVKILSKLKPHRNIVKYYDYNMDKQDHISLYMEYIQQGSLYDYTRKRGKLDEHLIRNFTLQILSGLFHLHHFKVVHRDIKSENLLVDSNGTIKLVDFGLAKTLAKSVSKHSVGGTLCYAAPELLQNKPYHSSSEGSAADIWSLGCVIIEMFTGELPEWPFPDPPQPHPPIPEGLCEEGKDFLKLCFIRNLADRPSAEKLLEHPFVKAQTGADERK